MPLTVPRAVERMVGMVIVLLLTLASLSSVHAQEDAPWQIAVAGPMSGDSEALGRAMLNSTQLRVDAINEAGGIDGKPVNIVVHDDPARSPLMGGRCWSSAIGPVDLPSPPVPSTRKPASR
jgi:hypothetical protein